MEVQDFLIKSLMNEENLAQKYREFAGTASDPVLRANLAHWAENKTRDVDEMRLFIAKRRDRSAPSFYRGPSASGGTQFSRTARKGR